MSKKKKLSKKQFDNKVSIDIETKSLWDTNYIDTAYSLNNIFKENYSKEMDKFFKNSLYGAFGRPWIDPDEILYGKTKLKKVKKSKLGKLVL